MSSEAIQPTPPEGLLKQGRDWALRQHMSERNEAMQERLRGMFGNLLEIYHTHRTAMLKRIADEGGIAKYLNEFADDAASPRGVLCKSGAKIYARDFFSITVLNQQLPVLDELSGATQEYTVKVLFGGSRFGFKAEEGDSISGNVNLDRDSVNHFLDQDYYPDDICIKESVTTRFESWSDTASRSYDLHTRIWQPSFDGFDVGSTRAEMFFTATKEESMPDGKIGIGMFTYVNEYGVREPEEAFAKLARFAELWQYTYKKVTGKDYHQPPKVISRLELSPGQEE